MKVSSVKEIQEFDNKTINEFGIPSLVLMERASLGVVDVIEKELNYILTSKKIALIVVGTGNNGGDGLVIARLLHTKNKQVHVLLIGNDSKRTVENNLQLDLIKKLNISHSYYSKEEFIKLAKDSDIIIDSIFGVGLIRELSGKYKEIVSLINTFDCLKLAVDIPSGIDANTGQILGEAVKADYTVTFAYPKTGLFMDSAIDFVGKLSVIDIGIPKFYEKDLNINLVDENFIKNIAPKKRSKNSFKNQYGRLLLIGGSKNMSGAIVLAGKSALKSGVGLLNIIVPQSIHSIVASQIPTAMVTPISEKDGHIIKDEALLNKYLDTADTVAFGPGIGTNLETEEVLKYIMENYKKPLVIDADALNLLSKNISLLEKRNDNITVLTPHVGELSRLLNTSTQEIQKDRILALKTFIEKYNAILVLKGVKTLISQKGEEIYINSSGSPTLARGGSGDILTGIIGSLLAQNIKQNTKAIDSVILSVYIHGLLANLADKELNEHSIMTEELIKYLNLAFDRIK